MNLIRLPYAHDDIETIKKYSVEGKKYIERKRTQREMIKIYGIQPLRFINAIDEMGDLHWGENQLLIYILHIYFARIMGHIMRRVDQYAHADGNSMSI